MYQCRSRICGSKQPRTNRPLRRRKSRRCGARRGAAAVEFALLMLLLPPIVFAAVDFGRFAHAYIAVTNAAREGAAYATAHRFTAGTRDRWQQNIEQTVRQEMGSLVDPADDPPKLHIDPPEIVTDGVRQERVKISVTYDFRSLVAWNLGPIELPDHVLLRRTVWMRAIGW